MSHNIKVEENYVDSLLRNAAWESAGINLISEAKKAKKEMKEMEDEEEAEEKDMKESVETHVCPLCESTLEEELTDDQIFEHVSEIQQMLVSLEEAKAEDEEEDEEEVEEAMAPQDDEEEDEEKPSMDEKKAKVLSKVKAMKTKK